MLSDFGNRAETKCGFLATRDVKVSIPNKPVAHMLHVNDNVNKPVTNKHVSSCVRLNKLNVFRYLNGHVIS